MLTSERMQELARAGARERIRELRAEITELETAFPDPGPAMPDPDPVASAPEMPRRRRTMSPAERKAASLRMKAVWKAKKAAEGR